MAQNDHLLYDPDNECYYYESRSRPRGMGTKARWAYRFRGRYYIHYHEMASNPDALGVDLLENVPTDPKKYLEWKTNRIQDLVKLEEKLNRGEKLSQFDSEPSYIPPLTDIYVWWTYVIDLDRDIFTVNESAHFNLLTVPRGRGASWIAALVRTGMKRVVSGGFSKEFTADIRPLKPEPNPDHIKLYRSLNPSMTYIGTSIFPTKHGFRPEVQLGKRLFLDFIVEYAFYLHEVYQWSPQDEPFQQLAFGILSLACGCHAGYNFMEPTPGQTRTLEPDRVPRWSYPKGDRYWLPNGVWVLLKTHLDDELQVESAVGDVILKAQNEGLATNKPFRAVIFSIRHVMSVVVAKGGKEVFRTRVRKTYQEDLIEDRGTPGRYSKRQLRRFGYHMSWIDKFPPGFNDLLRYFDSDGLDGEGQVNPARLPVELIHQIFEYSDPSTRQHFFNTSRLFRQIARKDPTFGRYIIKGSVQETEFWALEVETAERLRVLVSNYPVKEACLTLGLFLNYGERNAVGALCYSLVPEPLCDALIQAEDEDNDYGPYW